MGEDGKNVGEGGLVVAAADAGLELVGLSIRDPLPGTPAPPTGADPPVTARLCVRDELHQVVIGPLQRPGRAGCPGCADLRRWATQPSLLGLRRLRSPAEGAAGETAAGDPAGDAAAPFEPGSLTAGGVGAVVRALLADEIERLGRPGKLGTPRTEKHVLTVRSDGQVRRHPLVPHPHCDCGPQAEPHRPDEPDGPAAASMPLDDRVPLHDPYAVRGRDLLDAYGTCFDTLVDDEFGVLGTPFAVEGATAPTAGLSVGIAPGDDPEIGWGRTFEARRCRILGAAEALERLGGMIPESGVDDVLASRRELRDRALDAIDPETLGLYPDDRHELPGFPFVRYHPDRPMRWTPGWSMTRSHEVLVPTSYAYFRHFRGIGGVTGQFHPPPPDAPDAPFVFHISNGTALGASFGEAVFHGLLELAERDAFLLTWYTRMPVPEIELDSARDRRLVALATLLRQRTGFRIRCYDTTLDTGIPSVWTLAQDERNGRQLSAAGAALRPESAAWAALVELSSNLESVPALADSDPARVQALAAHPSLVRVMLDHSLSNVGPAAAPRFAFLTDRPPPTRGFEDVERDADWPAARTVGEHLSEALRRFRALGLEVIAVEATRTEHRALDLRCVKVIVPGMLPMTFGHDFRRTDGLPRLLTVPYALGHTDRPLRPDEPTALPHPFP